MLVPIADWRGLLAPSVKGEEAALSDCETIRRMGLPGLVMAWLSKRQLASPIDAEKERVLRQARVCVGPFSLSRPNDARVWLNAGAIYALFAADAAVSNPAGLVAALEHAKSTEALPAERLAVLLHVSLCAEEEPQRLLGLIEALAARNGSGCHECENPSTVGVVGAALIALVPPASAVDAEARNKAEAVLIAGLASYARQDRLLLMVSGLHGQRGASSVAELHKAGIHLAAPATLGFDQQPNSCAAAPALADAFAPVPYAEGAMLYDVGSCLVAVARTDRPDKLFATLVDELSGPALGLVYSSEVSIIAAVRKGRGIYWSRSRQSLWQKGASSGAWQHLVRIDVDCDSDALRFVVEQHGEPPAFCHRNTLTCWGAPAGLRELQATLESRKLSAPAGSYTKRLFDDSNLLQQKLVEEAQELAEATDVDHVAAEAADLFYFAMVRVVAAGGTLALVEDHLNRRALKIQRRPGHAKQARTDAANKILLDAKAAKEKKSHTAEPVQATEAPKSRTMLPIVAMVAFVIAMQVF
mmetsp:Transcript_8484/g.19861  ORF Transcript_8484/g.19861 Transcript_8484/m.19861 type:complete len:529 (-) Transcript_8484:400-1986(-)